LSVASQRISLSSYCTKDLDRRIRQHNGLAANRSTFTKRFKGTGKLVIRMGPMERKLALSLENRMKRHVVAKGGLDGRLKAVAKLLSLPSYVAKTTRLTAEQLQAIHVDTSVSRERFMAVTSTDADWLDTRHLSFDANLE
jgi:predicted GIY-YIG superfamily endonuclease